MKKKKIPHDDSWEVFTANGCVVAVVPKEIKNQIRYEVSLRTTDLDIFVVKGGFETLYEAMSEVEDWATAMRASEQRYAVVESIGHEGFCIQDRREDTMFGSDEKEVDVRKRWFDLIHKNVN